MHYIRILLAGLLFLGTAWAERALDLEAFKKDARIFEGIVSERLKQEFPNPFSLTAEPRSAYLPQYGLVLSFDLSINRAVINWPWGQLSPPRATDQRDKKDQLQRVRDTIVRCLAHHGTTVNQLNGKDRISVFAHVEDRNELDPTKRVTVVVITVTHEDIEAFSLQRISFREFMGRVQIAEY